jgi:UDP-perosamine 4-acetyltransferase
MIYVIGGGGHAKVLIDILLQQNKAIVAILEKDSAKIGEQVIGISVMDEQVLNSNESGNVSLVNGIGSLPGKSMRRTVYERYKHLGFSFLVVQSSYAVVNSDVELAEGVQIMSGCVIQPGTKLGANVIVNTNASIDHDCIIGDHVHIAPGATLCGEVAVDDDVHIGSGATIIQGIKIGRGAVIGAGAVVTRDVPPECTVYPAKSEYRRNADKS